MQLVTPRLSIAKLSILESYLGVGAPFPRDVIYGLGGTCISIRIPLEERIHLPPVFAGKVICNFEWIIER